MYKTHTLQSKNIDMLKGKELKIIPREHQLKKSWNCCIRGQKFQRKEHYHG